MAVLSAILTAGVTSATHAIQIKYLVSSHEFLTAIMPKQTCIMLIIGPLIDYATSRGGVVYTDFEWSRSAVFSISITCLLAVGVNMFTVFLIGKTSALAYQVVGHLKTILILAGGFWIFDHSVSIKTLTGSFIALVGCISYGFFKNKDLGQGQPKARPTDA